MQLCWCIVIGPSSWLSCLVFWIVSSLVLSEYPSLWEELAKYFDPCLSFLTSGSHYTNARKDFAKWKMKISCIHFHRWVWMRQVQKGVRGFQCLWLISQHACLPDPAHQLAATVLQRPNGTREWSGPVLSVNSSALCQDSPLQPAHGAWY